jgi:hypothetical protein
MLNVPPFPPDRGCPRRSPLPVRKAGKNADPVFAVPAEKPSSRKLSVVLPKNQKVRMRASWKAKIFSPNVWLICFFQTPASIAEMKTNCLALVPGLDDSFPHAGS